MNMILTTAPSTQGKRITEYKEIVFDEAVAGVNFLKDFAAGIRNSVKKFVVLLSVLILGFSSCGKSSDYIDESPVPDNYSSSSAPQRYLAFEFRYEGRTLYWEGGANVEASVDEGATWVDVTDDHQITLPGTKVYIRAKSAGVPIYHFNAGRDFYWLDKVYGHLGSLIDYTEENLDYIPIPDNQFSNITLDADGNVDLTKDQYGLFYKGKISDYENSTNFSKVNVQLPKTEIIGTWAYALMFALALDVDASVKTMSLPSTSLTVGCYYGMFMGWCGKVVPVTKLPAENLCAHCYERMFYQSRQSSLPALGMTSLAPYCCAYMFSGMSYLKKTGSVQLKPTEAASHCYESMFENCNALEEIGVNQFICLTDTKPYCCKNMFKHCEVLYSNAFLLQWNFKPKRLVEGSCYGMFRECHKIPTAYIMATSVESVSGNDPDKETKGPVAFMYYDTEDAVEVACLINDGSMRDIDPDDVYNWTTHCIKTGPVIEKLYLPDESMKSVWDECAAGGIILDALNADVIYYVGDTDSSAVIGK